MNRAKILGGAVCILISIFMIEESYRLRIGSLQAPDAGFWPFVMGIFFMVFSCFYFMKVFTLRNQPSDSFWKGTKWHKPLMTAILIFLYCFSLERAGFILSTIFLLLFLFYIDKHPKVWFAVGGAIVSSIAVYAIFDLWLKTNLPRGPWGF